MNDQLSGNTLLSALRMKCEPRRRSSTPLASRAITDVAPLSSQALQVGGDVAGLFLGDTQVRHVGPRFHALGIGDPPDKVVGGVRQLSGDERAAAELGERRPDESV